MQHVCGSKARGTIQGHVPGERSVSSPASLYLPSSVTPQVKVLVSKVCIFILPELGPYFSLTVMLLDSQNSCDGNVFPLQNTLI